MKKKVFVMTIMVGIMLMLCSCGKSESVAKLKDIPIQSEFILFDYQELKETSKLIVKAKIMDDLSKENSVIEMDTEDTDSISSAYSLRNIELLEIYGGDNADQFQSGDKLTIIDNAAIHDNNYIHIEGYEKLEKGQIYILYLSNDTASGDYSIISANNGKVEFDKVNQLQGDEFEIVIYLALFLKDLVCCLNPGHSCRTIGEGSMNVAVIVCCVRVYECGNLKAAGGVGDYGLVLRLQCPEHASYGNACTAAGT